MKINLVVNPFSNISFRNGEDCLLVSPKLEDGLYNLTISKSEKPHLFELFLDLSQIRLDFLDIENDLDDEERELLYQSGVLVEADKVPQKPMFSCQLAEIENLEYFDDISSLVVNPNFRFEPVNLNNFNDWIQQKHLLPYQPSVWVKMLLTEIEMGYWLDEQQTETVSKFKAGEKIPFEIEKNLLSKLISAEILISDKILQFKQKTLGKILKQSEADFKQNKYAVIRNLLPASQMKAMRNYYWQYVQQGFMPFSDSQVKRRYYQHNEPLAKFLHENLTKTMSLIVGEAVKPSYVYAASYKEGAVLTPHTDRPQCEFSFSFQVDYQPETENQISPWGLFVAEPDSNFNQELGYTSGDFPAQNEAEDIHKAAYLASGDALAYKGCELIHYRYELPKGHISTSLFFHYVPVNFVGELG